MKFSLSMFSFSFKKWLSISLGMMLLLLVGCSGGGASTAGTSGFTNSSSTSSTSSTTTTSTTTSSDGAVTISLLNKLGAEVSDLTLSQTEERYLKAVVTDGNGATVGLTGVTFTISDASLVSMDPTSGETRTNASGIALVSILPNNRLTNAVVKITAKATINDKEVTSTKTLYVLIPPGTSSTSDGSISIALLDKNNATVSDLTLSQTENRFLKATVLDSKGKPVPYTYVAFQVSNTDKVSMSPSSGETRTDANGIAMVKIIPSSVSANAVSAITAKTMINGIEVNSGQAMYVIIEPGIISFGTLTASPTTVDKNQTIGVSVPVQINGSTAPANAIAVDFSSTCGIMTPAAANVDGSGLAKATLATNQSGSCQITASYNGKSATTTVTVNNSPVTAIQFTGISVNGDTTKRAIYQQGSTGAKTAQVYFKVLDAQGNPIAAEPVVATLSQTDGGINFCGASTTASTNQSGIVTFSVCSGTVPTTVQIQATLANNSTISTVSDSLTVQTGLPTQRFFSLSASTFNCAAATENIECTTLTVSAADRLGNPVPPGTPIYFIASGGMINDGSGNNSCLTGATGQCTVKLYGQDYRPVGFTTGETRPLRVTVLAMTDGEESFVDQNNNNRYDSGEPFEDLGVPFLDKNEDGIYQSTLTDQNGKIDSDQLGQLTTPGATGSAACPADGNVKLSQASTCNGTWDRLTKLRKSITIVFSKDSASGDENITVLTLNSSMLRVRLADVNGNPLPKGTNLTISNPDGTNCTAVSGMGKIGNTIEPTTHTFGLSKCVSGDRMILDIDYSTSKRSFNFTIP